MPLRPLPASLEPWEGKRVLVRVDWNVPLGVPAAEGHLKITRTVPLLHRLQNAGAKVVAITHLGQPVKGDKALSTERLLPALRSQGLHPHWLGGDITKASERQTLLETVARARPGSLFLLENARFFPGEEKNGPAFAKALAAFGDAFVNEAFAVCHRPHTSVVGVPKLLPAYAGPALLEEVRRLQAFRGKSAAPALAFFGGKKLSSKLPVLSALAKNVQAIYLGGAMATACEAARGRPVGASFVEAGQAAAALRLLRTKRIHLPPDYLVADAVSTAAATRICHIEDIRPREIIVDVGPETLAGWAAAIRTARTILWNGPVGITDPDVFAAGSRGLARFLAFLAKRADVVVGGGDTVPLLEAAGVMDAVGYVSTGGGAMLDFLAEGERLPGLQALFARGTQADRAS